MSEQTMRDPRVEPRAGDVIRLPDGFQILIRDVRRDWITYLSWARVDIHIGAFRDMVRNATIIHAEGE